MPDFVKDAQKVRDELLGAGMNADNPEAVVEPCGSFGCILPRGHNTERLRAAMRGLGETQRIENGE